MIVEVDFPDHWKTRMLVDLLGADEAAPVYVLRLWAHCQNRRQWVFDNLPSAALKALCRFPGHANKLESSLATSDFIRRDEAGVITVLKWEVYNASLVANWENGKKGGRPKKPIENPSETHGIPMANPNETDREDRFDSLEKENPDLSLPEKKPPSPDAPKQDPFPELFTAFWKLYPTRNGIRVGKSKAFALWKDIPAADREKLLPAVTNYAKSLTIPAKDGFTPAPRDAERFLKADWWRDWVDAADPTPIQAASAYKPLKPIPQG